MATSTVVVSVYNKEKYLKNALMSLEKQENKDFDVIIIDDKSTDNSRDIVKDFANKTDMKVRLIFNKENIGISQVRNLCIGLVDTPYITFLDGDDFLNPYFIDKMNMIVSRHSSNSFDLIRGNVVLLDEAGSIVSNGRMSNYREEEIIYPMIDYGYVSNEIISCNGRYFNTDFIKNFKFYDSNIEDYEFFLDLVSSSPKIIYTNYAIYNYVDNPTGRVSNSIKNPYQIMVDCLEISARVRKRNEEKEVFEHLKNMVEVRGLETVLRELKLNYSADFKKYAAWYITSFFKEIVTNDPRFGHEYKLLREMMGSTYISEDDAMIKMKKIAMKH